MIEKRLLRKVEDYLWRIPKSTRPYMRVPADVYAMESLIEDMIHDRTFNQLINMTTLPGIQKSAILMPDGHEGYGFPVGGIAATSIRDGVISPGGIGYDINCGVRLLKSKALYQDVKPVINDLVHEIARSIPKGVGRAGQYVLSIEEIDEVLVHGAGWAVKRGYGFEADLDHIESGGCLLTADPSKISTFAKQRGHDQLGTLGAGNHFIEIDCVDMIYDEVAAGVFGLFPGQIVILVHTGSRGLGHQVASDYLKKFLTALPSYGYDLPDRELACAPIRSEDGQDYFKAMSCAANFAWCNREMISWGIRTSWQRVLKEPAGGLELLYDVAHNIAKKESHLVNGIQKEVMVHRKGATRAFGPGHPEIPICYRDIGQPVLIPGSMGTFSYVLVGTEESMLRSFGSSCHGAGRRMSRTAAKKMVDAPSLKKELQARNIAVEAGSYAGLAEEAPLAYKDIESVVETVHRANLAKKVARLRPVGVIKG